jgi:hypothetical protein
MVARILLPDGGQFNHWHAYLSVLDLEHLRDLTEAGHLQIPIFIPFPLADIKQVFQQLEPKCTVG